MKVHFPQTFTPVTFPLSFFPALGINYPSCLFPRAFMTAADATAAAGSSDGLRCIPEFVLNERARGARRNTNGVKNSVTAGPGS